MTCGSWNRLDRPGDEQVARDSVYSESQTVPFPVATAGRPV